jgi:hypothetical protein
MANSTIGANGAYNNWLTDATQHQAWVQNFAAGNLGRMIQVNTRFASNAGGTGGAAAWQNTGLQLFTNAGAIGAGNVSTGAGTAVRTSGGDSPFVGSDNWQFGMWCSTGIFAAYTTNGGTSFVKAGSNSAVQAATGASNNYSAYGTGGGQQIAFGTYFIVEFYIRRSGGWSKAFVYARRAGAWPNPIQTFIWRGGGWTQVAELVRRKELDWKREIRALIRWPDGTWDHAIARWDYDRPRYMGVGYPGTPEWDAWEKRDSGLYAPQRPYELSRAA